MKESIDDEGRAEEVGASSKAGERASDRAGGNPAYPPNASEADIARWRRMDQRRDKSRREVPELERQIAAMADCSLRRTLIEILAYRREDLAAMERQQYLPACRPSLERHIQRQKERVAGMTPRQRRASLTRRALVATTRARALGCQERHTGAELADLLARQNERCASCGDAFDGLFHVDHIVSLSNGGGNSIKNIQLLCVPCNMRKGNRDEEWIAKAN